MQLEVGDLDDAYDRTDEEDIACPDVDGRDGDVEVDDERECEEEQPEVEVTRVAEDVLVGVVVPAAREGRPDALAEDVQGLGAHAERCDEGDGLGLNKEREK